MFDIKDYSSNSKLANLLKDFNHSTDKNTIINSANHDDVSKEIIELL
jgi:hypothetical protein